jgi:hypothetical protein
VNDWDDYQQTSAVTRARSEHARTLANKRWQGSKEPE